MKILSVYAYGRNFKSFASFTNVLQYLVYASSRGSDVNV